MTQTTKLLVRIEAKIDAILRGQHAGWDQAMGKLRDEIREEIKIMPNQNKNTRVPEIVLPPGWLQRDIERAQARLREWGVKP